MSYLKKTKHTFWKLEDAVKQKISSGSRSVESALQSIRSDLDFYDNPTAVAWKNSWKSMEKSYGKDTSQSIYNTFNNNGTMINTTIRGDTVVNKNLSFQALDQTKGGNGLAEQDESSQSDSDSIDIEFPSDLSKDYHPLVEEDLYDISQDQPQDEVNTNIWEYDSKDSDEVCVINDELRNFRRVSLKLEPKSLSDLRLLSLNDVYLFTEEIETSITSYLPEHLHQNIMRDISNDPVVSIGDRCILWCTKTSTLRLTNWLEVQKTTIPFLHTAMLTMDEHPQDLILANILHRAAMILANGKPDSEIEDSFVHNFISNLFENVFQTESILDTAWANGQLGGKRRNEEDEQSPFKPDYAVFVKQRSLRLDLLCAEAKSPVNTAVFPKSDLVKIAQEMKWMLNKLVREGVEAPVVGGVLVNGFTIYTFKMELIDSGIYRMVQLSKILLFKNFQELVLLPTIVANLLQLKNITLTTANKAKNRLLKKAKGISPEYNPPLSWLRDTKISLTKRTKKE
ncbi:hypothetical protein CLU79DRAFT_781547 [Phycomyces nitens]|nr:hypothetical protein CLU79DRAFT_781547 [Phycomyces nitens]